MLVKEQEGLIDEVATPSGLIIKYCLAGDLKLIIVIFITNYVGGI